MKIEARKEWSMRKVRQMCVNHRYYTCGDCEDYDRMLMFVINNEPTTENIYKVAKDIVEHSDMDKYDCDKLELIEAVMFDIDRECATTHYEIEA